MIYHLGLPVHTYIVPGDPIPWERARLNGKTFFDAQRYIKNNWAISLQYQRETQPFYEKIPLQLIAHFYFSAPQSLRPQKREELIGQPYIHKKDVDNLIKFLCDTCTGILYQDDCLIYSVYSTKTYDLEPRTEFALVPLNPLVLKPKKKEKRD